MSGLNGGGSDPRGAGAVRGLREAKVEEPVQGLDGADDAVCTASTEVTASSREVEELCTGSTSPRRDSVGFASGAVCWLDEGGDVAQELDREDEGCVVFACSGEGKIS